MRPTLTLGVLGIGPAATFEFLHKVRGYTPSDAEHEQIRVIADVNPHLPDLATPGSGAGPALAEAAGALRGAGADVLAIVSDAAHTHLSLVERASGLPVIDMIATVCKAVHDTGAMRVGVLGSRGALRIYREYLAAQAMGLASLDSEAQAEFAALLQAVRDGDQGPGARAALTRLAQELVSGGAEAVIAGAPEIAFVLAGAGVKVPLIDPAEHLARRSVAVCLGLEPAPTVAG